MLRLVSGLPLFEKQKQCYVFLLIVKHTNMQRSIELFNQVMFKNECSPFDLVHSYVLCAPLVFVCGHRYFVTFIDDAIRCTWVHLMHG